MTTRGEINSNFYQIVNVDANGAPTSVKPEYIPNISNVANANYANFANIANTANSVSVANVVGIGNIATINKDGSSSHVLYGNGTWANITVAPSANANYANYAGNAFSVDAGNIVGTVNLANYATTANAVAGANVSGYVANATHANISDSANSVAVANVSGIGNIATINLDGNVSNLLAGNGSWIPVPSTANANYANYAGNAFSVDAGNIVGTVNLANYATVANLVAVANVSGIGNIATVNLTGSTSNVLYGNGAFAAIPTVSNVANANYANYAGNATSADTILSNAVSVSGGYLLFAPTSANGYGGTYKASGIQVNPSNSAVVATTFVGNLSGNVPVANVTGIGNIATINLTGSSANILYGNGAFAAPAAVTTVANANAVLSNTATTTTVYPMFTSSSANGYVATLKNTGITANLSNASITATTFVGALSGLASSATVAASANSVAGANVTGTVASATVAASANSVAVANVSGIGNIATLNLNGNSGQVLYGNGTFSTIVAANATAANTILSNATGGTGYLLIAGGNGNGWQTPIKNSQVSANLSTGVISATAFDGDLVATTSNNTLVHVAATTGIQSNISGVVIQQITSSNITISKPLVSNVATGNAPFQVSSTTRVTNLNVASAGVADSANSVAVANVSGIGNIATVNLTGSTSNVLYGNGVFAAIPAVTSVANANYANYAGNATISNSANSVAVANVSGIGNIATINLDGNVANVLTGLGTFVTLPTVSANANYANFAGNAFSVDAGNIVGTVNLANYATVANSVAVANVSGIGNIATINLTGSTSNVLYGNGAFAPITVTSVANANYANFAGSVLTNAQPNITSTGTLTNLNVTGNIQANGKALIGLSSTTLTNPIAVFSGSGATYSQVGVINPSGSGSADIVAYGNNGDDTQSWVDMGFTGNTFSDANYTITAAGDGYLFSQGNSSFGGNLVIATGAVGTTKDIIFATGGFLTGNIKARLYNSNGTFAVTSNVSANYFIGNGSALTGITASPAGSNTQLQYNNAGVTGASANLTYDDTTRVLNLPAANSHIYLGNVGSISMGFGVGTDFITLNSGGSGNITMGGNLTTYGNITANTGYSNIANLQLTKFVETVPASANTSTSISPNMASGTIVRYTANANFSFNGFSNAVSGQSGTVILTQDATGGRTMTSTMKFAGGSKTLSTAPNAIDIITVFYDGSSYYAALSKGFV